MYKRKAGLTWCLTAQENVQQCLNRFAIKSNDPRYTDVLHTVQGCQCKGQGSLDKLQEAQMDGKQSHDKEGAAFQYTTSATATG